jgi:ATP-dependent DNA helicase RecG
LTLDLSTSLKYLKGVGPARAAALEAKGMLSIEDLLQYLPFRYEDRSNVKPINQLAPGEMATVIAAVDDAQLSGFKRRNLGIFEAQFSDGSGSTLTGKWFHGKHLVGRIAPGMKIALFGKVEFDTYRGDLNMMHPEFEILGGEEDDEPALHLGRIVPIYEAAGKVNTRALRTLIHRILESVAEVPDPMPEGVLRRLRLPDRHTALKESHFPSPGTDLRLLNAFRSQPQFRLIYEEFFWLECGLALKRNQARVLPGIAFETNARVREQVKRLLPFKPTNAQLRVVKEIADDMRQPVPMNRLLQGDVGSGKTICAAQAAVIAIENGYQVAILAPTEILATQHYSSFRALFQRIGYEPLLLTGSFTAREKSKLKLLLSTGTVRIAIGTHALIQEDVGFENLGLVVIDEQHRFGVMQRMGIVRKGKHPDVLVMTATPIPRTLSMTLYGDLDVSIIDELPPGRQPIRTRHVESDRIEKVWSFVKREVDAGRQAYVVYPVVEESETQAMKAATQMYAHLREQVFPGMPVGLLHGRMPAAEKEAAMADFKTGRTSVLVATTVIEVGVDVPNATVMVVEQAERFGLSQLHQLRGRVGRGAEQSTCVLVTEKMNDTARERIRTLVESNDGFYIAEMDLKLRGPGEFFGTKQSGLPSLRIANLLRDVEILEAARRDATALVAHPADPQELQHVTDYVRNQWQHRYGLLLVG